MLFSAFIAWGFARRKNNSEIKKNDSEIIKTYIDIVAKVTEELDTLIESARKIKLDAGRAEDLNEELRRSINEIRRQEAERLKATQLLCKAEKASIALLVDKALTTLSYLLDELVVNHVSQAIRIKLVQALEILHTIKEKLEKPTPIDDTQEPMG